MTSETTPKKKLIRLRDALWIFAKLVGGVAAYLGALALVVDQLTSQVNAEKLSPFIAMVSAVYLTALLHALIGVIYITTD